MDTLAPRKWGAIVACLLPAAYFLATAAFALLHYDDYASEMPQFLRYVVVPGIIGLLLTAAAVAIPPRFSMKVGTSVIAAMAGLFAFEALMTVRVLTILLGYFGAGEASTLHTANAVDGLPPGYTVKRLNRMLGSKELSSAALSGLPNTRVLLCWQGKEPVYYEADHFGFNNPDGSYEGQLETAVVGDSFIEGMCQSPGKDVTSMLRGSNAARVSLGSRGAGPLFQLAVLGRFGKTLRPRHVIFAFFEGNDWDNLQQELTLPWLRPGLQQDADYGPAVMPDALRAKAASIMGKVRQERIASVEVLTRTRIVRNFFALNQTMTQLGLAYPKTAPDVPEFAEVLQRAKELTTSWGGQMSVVYIPQSTRYIGVFPRHFAYDGLRRRVFAAAAQAELDIIDLVEIFDKESDPASLYAPDAHFSDRGASLTAAAIDSRIRQQSLDVSQSPAPVQ